MSTIFPSALDSLTNPLGSDTLAVVSHAAQHTNANDAIEALQVRVGITGSTDPASLTYRVSADGEGAAIAALTAKTTPVDADLVGLSDSAAGGVLKKLSWSSIKTALQSVFATLAGIAGGQTLIGGTGATDKLTLQGTSGTGTAGATAINALVGDAGGTEAVTILNNGNVGIGNTNPSADLTVGADTFRVDNGLMAFGSGASLGPVITKVSLSPFNSPVNHKYDLTDPTVRQAGATDIITFAPTSSPLTQIGHIKDIIVPASNAYNFNSNLYGEYVTLSIGGSGVMSGGNSSVSYSTGTYSATNTCSFLGGVVGILSNLSTGTLTKANALNGVMVNNAGGSVGTAWGTEGDVYNNSAGTITTAICVGAGLSNSAAGTITNAYGVNIGGPGEGWPSAGTVTNAYGLYIGSAVNYGTNKWSIYNASPAVSYLAGSLALGVTAASAKVHAISTTEQLRLGYDASNYTSATVDSTGKTTRTGVGTAPNFKWLVSDATTNAVYDLVTFSKNTSGTGANGLGVRMILSAQSSTTADTAQGAIESTWATATHASRKGRLTFSAYDTAIREGIRVEASGTAAMLGFFGVTAVVKPTALTTQLTTLTYTAPTTPDYAIAAVTQTTPFGFTTADEAHTVLSVIKNLQDRVGQLETKLRALGLLT